MILLSLNNEFFLKVVMFSTNSFALRKRLFQAYYTDFEYFRWVFRKNKENGTNDAALATATSIAPVPYINLRMP